MGKNQYVLFSCKGCKINKLHVDVIQRKANQSWSEYVNTILKICGFQHGVHSPHCESTTIDLFLTSSIKLPEKKEYVV